MNYKSWDWRFEGVYKGFGRDQLTDITVRMNREFKAWLFNSTDCYQSIDGEKQSTDSTVAIY